MELAFAGLHQLCLPLVDDLESLPTPQREALGMAFGLTSGPPASRFLVGLAVLSLLSSAAEAQPVVCLVDDAQWLDRSSGQALAFVARRLQQESVLLLFAERDGHGESELGGLPELRLRGLSERDARALLASQRGGPVDERGRNRLIAETRGNPVSAGAAAAIGRFSTSAARARTAGSPVGSAAATSSSRRVSSGRS
jgi:hypothetical protein